MRSPSLRKEINSRFTMHIFNRPNHQHACTQADSRMMQARSLSEIASLAKQ